MDHSLNSADWPSPSFIEGPSILPWPKDIFPPPFGEFMEELARSTETPIELASILLLATVSTAIQKRYSIQIKPDYAEPINLYTAAVLPPASRKSQVYSMVTKPLMQWECDERARLEPLHSASESNRKTLEVRIKELRAQAAKGTEEQFLKLQGEILKLEGSLGKPEVFPQLWTADVTPENLATIMAANEEAMGILSDEGGIFDILAGLYSDGRANIDLFLHGHSGGAVRVDRGSRPPIFIKKATLTFGLTIQPHTLRSICKNRTFRGRGLLGRFLYVIPGSNIGSRTLDEAPMNRRLQEQYDAAIAMLLLRPHHSDAQHDIFLSKEAFGEWMAFARAIEQQMAPDSGPLCHITDWAGKLAGAVARIAGNIHVMRHRSSPWAHEISRDDMASAALIGAVLISHALCVFDVIQEDGKKQIAKAILSWIKNHQLNCFTRRDCSRRFRQYTVAELTDGLELLKESDVIRAQPSTSKLGRPSAVFEVNPRLFSQPSDKGAQP